MKILMVISTLGAGGAERVVTALASSFAARRHEVLLLTLESATRDFYPVDPAVTRLSLNRHGASASRLSGLLANLERVRALRRVILQARPDVVVSFITETNVLVVLACLGVGIPVLVSERVDPRAHALSFAWDRMRWFCYRGAAGIVVQTQAIADWLKARRRMPPVAVIPNPALAPALAIRAQVDAARAYLLGAGRLTRQKGFDVLLRAMALLEARGANLDLVIAGQGPEEGSLRRLAAELGLDTRVRFIGHTEHLTSWIQGAFAFVLSSRYEGFPNVLLEALATGTAAIATDCPTGPREILRDEGLGILVPPENPEALARAVLALQADPALRARLRARGPEVLQLYSVERVTGQWEELMRGALA